MLKNRKAFSLKGLVDLSNKKEVKQEGSQPNRSQLSPKEKELRQARYEQIRATIKLFCTQFPKCFDINNPKPLKEGVHKDLIDSLGNEGISNKLIRRSIKQYVNFYQYLEGLQRGNHRYDLAGKKCGVITSEQKALATEQFYKRRQLKLVKRNKGTISK